MPVARANQEAEPRMAELVSHAHEHPAIGTRQNRLGQEHQAGAVVEDIINNTYTVLFVVTNYKSIFYIVLIFVNVKILFAYIVYDYLVLFNP